MALQSYDDLKSFVAQSAIRDDLPIDALIALAESDFQPRLKHYKMEKSVALNAVAPLVAFPADFLEARRILVNGVLAKPVSNQHPDLYVGQVGYVYEGDGLRIVGDLAYPTTVELTYYAAVPALTPANTSNWLLTRFPAVYLHGVLARAYRWLKNGEAEALEKASLDEALQLVAADHARVQRGGNTIIVEGNTPW